MIKGSEIYSVHCGNIISRVGTDFVLIEPAILLAEVSNAVGRNIDLKTARQEADTLKSMIAVFMPCNDEFCLRSGLTGAEYDIFSADSLYLQTAIDYHTIIVSLDEEDFVNKIRIKKPPIEIYHVRDFPY